MNSLLNEIQTTEGNKSLIEIFWENKVDLGLWDCGSWIEMVNKEIFVLDENDNPQKISDLYIYGIDNAYEFEDINGNKYVFEKYHELKINDNFKRVGDILFSDINDLVKIEKYDHPALLVDIKLEIPGICYKLSNGWISKPSCYFVDEEQR